MISDDPKNAPKGLPADERFTRLTWRPGKRRRRQKRIKPYGGRKTAPQAFLEAAKATRFKPGLQGQRICAATKRDGNPCKRIALKHANFCGAHGGWMVWKRLGILQKTGKREQLIAERKTMPQPMTQTPYAITKLQIWKSASQSAKARMAAAYGTPAWATLIKRLARV